MSVQALKAEIVQLKQMLQKAEVRAKRNHRLWEGTEKDKDKDEAWKILHLLLAQQRPPTMSIPKELWDSYDPRRFTARVIRDVNSGSHTVYLDVDV